MKAITKIAKEKLSLLTLMIFLITTLSIVYSEGRYNQKKILNWDIFNYHLYLPATIIYHDLDRYEFLDSVLKVYNPSPGCNPFGIYEIKDKKTQLNKFPVGVAIFELPMFLIAHFATLTSGKYPADGFSEYYQLGVSLSTILFAFLGLLILRIFLRKYFSDRVSTATILTIAFGTNFFIYTALDSGLSHIYLFFCFSVILQQTDKWYETKKLKNMIFISIAIGLAILTRPTSVIVVLVPLLWGIKSFYERIELFRKHAIQIGIGFIIVFLIFSIQMVYWKYITGHFIHYSYHGEGFNFLHPEILKGLFSFRKGWFVYTPLVSLGFIGYFILIRQKRFKFFNLVFPVFFSLNIWLVFSWWNWFYGGGFGCRALLESLVFLSLPMAVFFEFLFSLKQYFLKFTIFIILSGFVYLNLFQTYQYKYCIIHWDLMNQEYYWKVFLKKSIPPDAQIILDKTKKED